MCSNWLQWLPNNKLSVENEPRKKDNNFVFALSVYPTYLPTADSAMTKTFEKNKEEEKC